MPRGGYLAGPTGRAQRQGLVATLSLRPSHGRPVQAPAMPVDQWAYNEELRVLAGGDAPPTPAWLFMLQKLIQARTPPAPCTMSFLPGRLPWRRWLLAVSFHRNYPYRRPA